MLKHTQRHITACVAHYSLLHIQNIPTWRVHTSTECNNMHHLCTTNSKHQPNTTPTLSSALLQHWILITSGPLVSSEQNQTATLKHTHTHACTQHKYPTPSVPNCGWHIKGPCPRREVREGLGNHGRQRKRLRDKDQSKIWHFILGRSGRHTPFREEYSNTREEGKEEEGRSCWVSLFQPSLHLSHFHNVSKKHGKGSKLTQNGLH